MKNIQLSLLLSSSLFLFSNCEKEFFGNSNCEVLIGPIVSQTIDLPTIHSIDTELPVELILTESPVQEITIESNQQIIDALLESSFVNNQKWRVQVDQCFDNDSPNNGFPIKINAALTTLKDLKLKGISKAVTNGILKNIDHLKIDVEGAIDIDFQLDSIQSLTTKLQGLGTFKLTGFTESHTIDLSGAGDIRAFDLTTNDCQIKIEGLGECEVTVLNSLTVEMSGGGKVCYKGTPSLNFNNQGNGQINNCN